MLSSSRLSRSLALATLGLGALTAQAGEIYANAGFPGVGLGYAHPLNSHFALRGDFMTLGTHKKDMNEEGIDYKGTLSTSRVALFADYFPFGGVFRLTAGITANNYKLELDASGAGQTINVGGTDYVLSANDGLNVQVKFPKTTPYLGIGWGHQQESGFRFAFDIGAMLGKAKVEATARGQYANDPNFQASLDQEVAELRDGVGTIKALPQITFSLGYSF